MKAPAWIADELAAATRANLYDATVRSRLPAEVAALFGERRGQIPYQFLGEAHPIVDVKTCRQRGWAACADAAAAIAASAVLHRIPATICVEAPRRLPTYVHVRVVVETARRPTTLDPYAANRAEVPASCEWVIDARDLVSGDVRMLPAVAV